MPDRQAERPDADDAHYQSYLLRLWQEQPGGGQRALLQDVLSGESRWFASLEALFAHLAASRGRPEGGTAPAVSSSGGIEGKARHLSSS